MWTNGNYWTSPIKIGAHHYARLLVESGWDVAFVSDPISPFHFLKWSTLRDTRERFRAWRQGGCRDLDNHLVYYTPFALLPHFDLPLLRQQWVLDHWPRLTLPNLRHRLVRLGFDRPELLVIDSVNQGFWLDAIRPGKSLMRVADDLAGFAGVTGAMLRREKELLGRVDVVAYTAHRLAAKIQPCQPRVMIHVPNGCELDHFLAAATEPDDLRPIAHPRALYVGAIDDWFDVPLLAHVARALPHVSFILIGPPRIPLEPLRALANVHVLGRRPYAEVSGYMQHADVGLIPFRITEMIRSVHPIKLYEYFACGLPVVAIAWDELEAIRSPACLCRTPDEFAAQVQAALAHPPAREELVAFARQADWGQRFQRIMQALGFV